MRYALAILFVLAILAPVTADEEPAPPTEEEVLEQMKDRVVGVRLAGTVDAARVQGKAVTTQLVKLLKDKAYQIRMAAAQALRVREGRDDRRKAALALAARLKPLGARAVDREEYILVIGALRDLARPETIKHLMDFDIEESRETAKDRLMAVANVPDAKAIEELINFLARGRKRNRNNQRQSAVAALRYATGEKMGHDPDAWRGWWRDAKSWFDFEAMAEARRAEEEAEAEKRAKAEERAAERERRRAEKERRRREKEEGGGSGGDDGGSDDGQ